MNKSKQKNKNDEKGSDSVIEGEISSINEVVLYLTFLNKEKGSYLYLDE